jgi:uncharacterized protein YegP (UPF0339 family)
MSAGIISSGTLTTTGDLTIGGSVLIDDGGRPGRLEVFAGNDGKWYVRLKGGNGGKIMQSEGYANKANAQRGARAAKRAIPGAQIVTVDTRGEE